VSVDGELVSTIGKGLLIFAALGKEDTVKEVQSMASKVLKVKLWDGEDGKKWKHNVQDIEGEVLCGAFLYFPRISRHVRPSWCHPLMINLPPVSSHIILY
jgi:D-Tyr-tRNAtyr deacylase